MNTPSTLERNGAKTRKTLNKGIAKQQFFLSSAEHSKERSRRADGGCGGGGFLDAHRLRFAQVRPLLYRLNIDAADFI